MTRGEIKQTGDRILRERLAALERFERWEPRTDAERALSDLALAELELVRYELAAREGVRTEMRAILGSVFV